MSPLFAVIIEAAVAVLLAATIGYCIVLNKRLARLKGDEQMLKAVAFELIAATEAAERSIANLKLTVQECDEGLGRRLKVAEAVSANLARQITAGEQVVMRLAKIAGFAQPAEVELAAPVLERTPTAPPVAPTPVRPPRAEPAPIHARGPDAHATAAAAQAFAGRARLRAKGAAA